MPRPKKLLEVDTENDATVSRPTLRPLSPLSPASATYYPMDETVGSTDFYRNPLSPCNGSSPCSVASGSFRSGCRRATSGSFSQSEDFRKMLQEDKASAPFVLQKVQKDFDDEEVYFVQQKCGYLSILFSLAQTIVLTIMMSKCGVAPLSINPMVGPYPDALSDWGGKNAVNILDDGEWWRLITPIMLHAGVIHLLCNVAVQLETGAFFEREWGSLKWLIVYLSSAVGSSVLSVIFMPDAISVGSSGAVMGLFGAKLSEVICRYCEPDRTDQERVGHQVRREQCAGVMCSVFIVMLFSFIPYGAYRMRVYLRWSKTMLAHTVYSGLGGTSGRSLGWILRRNGSLLPGHLPTNMEALLVTHGHCHDSRLLCGQSPTHVFGRNRSIGGSTGRLRLLQAVFRGLRVQLHDR